MSSSRMTVMRSPSRGTFGLFAVIESKRVTLPLKGVECDFSVVSGLVEVSMTQIFRQDNKKALDCEYLFPLPADASVYFCEADINGRTIRARVEERQAARRIAAEKKAAGFRTALVEAERENLFTLSLGNVQPRDLVIIQLKYFQTLRYLAGAPSIEIPLGGGSDRRKIPVDFLLPPALLVSDRTRTFLGLTRSPIHRAKIRRCPQPARGFVDWNSQFAVCS